MPSPPSAPSPKDTFITVYGRMPVLEVLQDLGLTVDKVVVAEGSRGDSLDRIRSLATRRGVEVRTASAHRVKVLAGNGKHDQGVLADVVAPRMALVEDFVQRPAAGGSDTVLVLDGVSNPSNVGMILRTATAAGLAGVVLPRVGSPGVDPLVVKASAGVAYRAPLLRRPRAAAALRRLRAGGGGGAERGGRRAEQPRGGVAGRGSGRRRARRPLCDGPPSGDRLRPGQRDRGDL